MFVNQKQVVLVIIQVMIGNNGKATYMTTFKCNKVIWDSFYGNEEVLITQPLRIALAN